MKVANHTVDATTRRTPRRIFAMLSPLSDPNSPRYDADKSQIVLVGASVRAAAESAKRAGFRVTGVDLFGDSDTRAACDRHFRIGENVDEIIRACQGVPTIQVGGLQEHDSLIRQLTPAYPSAGNWDQQDQLRELGYLRELSAQAGFRFPTTLEGAVPGYVVQASSGWLSKRRRGCGGLGVRWYDPRKDASTDEWIQKWIPGRAYGATLLSNGTEVRLLGVCRSLFTRIQDRPFVYTGSLGPLAVSSALARSLIRLGERVVTTTRLRGLWNVDFLLDRSGTPWLLEINPRWSGSSELIERQLIRRNRIDCDDSLLARLLSALGGDALPEIGCCADRSLEHPIVETWSDIRSRLPGDSVYLKRIVFAWRRLRFDRTRLTALLKPNESLHDLPSEGTVTSPDEPVCTLIQEIGCRQSKQDPMHRHRVLVRAIRGSREFYSPRSSA